MVVTQIALWSPDGNQQMAMAIYVSDVSQGAPVSINFFGQGIDGRGLLVPTTPMASAPTSALPSFSSLSLANISYKGTFVQTTGSVYVGGGILLPDSRGDLCLYTSVNGALNCSEQTH